VLLSACALFGMFSFLHALFFGLWHVIFLALRTLKFFRVSNRPYFSKQESREQIDWRIA